MSGVLNSTGAVSGILGTTVGGTNAADIQSGVLPVGVTGGSGLTALGTVASGTIGSNVQVIDMDVDCWHTCIDATVDYNSDAIIDFNGNVKLGSNVTESGGQITVGTAGWYFVAVKVHAAGNATDYAQLFIRKNGTQVAGARVYWESEAAGGYYSNWTMNFIYCVATNTIDAYGQGNFYGAGQSLQASMGAFWGFRIGK